MLWPFTGGPFQMSLSTVSVLEPQVPWGRLPSVRFGFTVAQPGWEQCRLCLLLSAASCFLFLEQESSARLVPPACRELFQGKGGRPSTFDLRGGMGSQSTAGAPS